MSSGNARRRGGFVFAQKGAGKARRTCVSRKGCPIGASALPKAAGGVAFFLGCPNRPLFCGPPFCVYLYSDSVLVVLAVDGGAFSYTPACIIPGSLVWSPTDLAWCMAGALCGGAELRSGTGNRSQPEPQRVAVQRQSAALRTDVRRLFCNWPD